MGYQSIVTIGLSGEKEVVKDALTAYKMTMDSETKNTTWNILDDELESTQHYSEWESNGHTFCCLIWKFEWIKFYQNSMNALCDLADIVENLAENKGAIGLTLRRIGESDDDFEYRDWGTGTDYEGEVHIVRDIEVLEPEVKDAKDKLFFKPEQTDMVSASSQQGEVK